MTIEEKKIKVTKFIDNLDKDLEREPNTKRELANDRATLEGIDDMVNEGANFPSDCPFDSYEDWRTAVEKEITTSEKNLQRVQEQKLEKDFYQFYLDNVS